MTKITEAHIQAVLMRWLMNEKSHQFCIPNSNQFFSWEADLISVTKSDLVHEFEIKLNIYDYRADAKKYKHCRIGDLSRAPAYFWYATYDFEIEPPEKAGWVLITQQPNGRGWKVDVKKEAPILNHWKVSQEKKEQIARILSWRLLDSYNIRYLQSHDPAPSERQAGLL